MASESRSAVRSGSKAAEAASAKSDLQTRDLLVLSALRLFARHGIEGVSLRQITAEAGQSNQSVVQYYFQSKEGLIEAVLAHVAQLLLPSQDAALDQLAAEAQQGPLQPRQVVAIGVMPFVMAYVNSDAGRWSIRFLSRMTWQADEKGFRMVESMLWPYFMRIERHLESAMPNQSRDSLQIKCLFAIVDLIHGLASSRLLASSPVVGEQYQKDPWSVAQHLIDYITGGLSYGPTSKP
jgi:AcrR family transcriptional regulator